MLWVNVRHVLEETKGMHLKYLKIAWRCGEEPATLLISEGFACAKCSGLDCKRQRLCYVMSSRKVAVTLTFTAYFTLMDFMRFGSNALAIPTNVFGEQANVTCTVDLLMSSDCQNKGSCIE